MSFHELSYRRHTEHFEADLTDAKRIAIGEKWFDKTTADYWRHARMYEAVDYFKADLDATWLTVGDGRFGLDAMRIAERGFRSVLPSDISEALLKKSKEQGRITNYAVENAERLTFADESFDYVFCKESYHHFPRPGLALYEMLRVARKAVILIEPNDTSNVPFRRVKHFVKTLLRGSLLKAAGCRPCASRHIDAGFYEESGNYIYSITKREMEKVALGLNLPLLAIKGLNDHFIEGCESEPASWKNAVYRRIRVRCALKDLATHTGLHGASLLMAVLFKQRPAEGLISRFTQSRWDVVRLPRNPYA